MDQRIIRFAALLVLLMLPASWVRSQTMKPATVGFLSLTPTIAPIFFEAMRERGYELGRNLKIEFRSAKSKEELPKLAAELVRLNPDVLIGGTTPSAKALVQETDSIPIVFFFVSDPVTTGLVKSLDHPGGNATGPSIADQFFTIKTMELIKETLPGICCLTMLRNQSNQAAPFLTALYEKTAKNLGIELKMMDADSSEHLTKVLATPPGDRFKTALLVTPESVFVAGRSQIIEYGQRQHLALFAPYRADAAAGALMSFGTSYDGHYRVMVDYVVKILGGARPADLPVQQPTAFDLTLNLKVAKTLGVEIPQSVLARATELIE